jgi:hypothetical protein
VPPSVAGSFLGAFVLAWILAGQRLAGIASYLENAAEIAAGYHDVMGTPGGGLQVGLAVACVLLLAGLCFATARARPRTSSHIALGAVTLAVVLLTWKAGFRAPGRRARPHLLRHGDAGAVRAAGRRAEDAQPLVHRGLRRPRRDLDHRHADCARSREPSVADAGPLGTTSARQRLRALAAPQRFAAEQAEEWRRNAAATPLEATRRALGGGSIDAFGHEQGIVLANSLRLRHGPCSRAIPPTRRRCRR